jgi:tetratricopeptide (TPR) repeat protein
MGKGKAMAKIKNALRSNGPVAVMLGWFLFLAVGSAVPAASQDTASLLAEGDALYQERADLAKAREAMAKYQAALLKGENAYDAYWKMARVEYWIGDHAPTKDDKRRVFEMGIYHGKKAVQAAPDKAEGHYWLAVNYGSYGEVKGVLKSLSLVKPLKAELNKVLEIDPAYDDGGADRILGRVYYELPGFFGGNKKKSLEHLLKSRDLGPRVGITRLYLADTYLALDDIEKARAELEFVIGMEPDPKLIPETADEKVLARKRLEQKDYIVRK